MVLISGTRFPNQNGADYLQVETWSAFSWSAFYILGLEFAGELELLPSNHHVPYTIANNRTNSLYELLRMQPPLQPCCPCRPPLSCLQSDGINSSFQFTWRLREDSSGEPCGLGRRISLCPSLTARSFTSLFGWSKPAGIRRREWQKTLQVSRLVRLTKLSVTIPFARQWSLVYLLSGMLCRSRRSCSLPRMSADAIYMVKYTNQACVVWSVGFLQLAKHHSPG